MHGERLERFLAEARMALQLDHENLAHLYEFGEREGACFVAVEWVDGVSLAEMIDSGGPVPQRIAARLAASIAAGIEHAHQGRDALGHAMQIVHGHLDAREVIVAIDGRVMVRGFVTSRTFAGPSDARSPEGAAGAVQDRRSDVFAVGACLHHALRGRAPFDLDAPGALATEDVAALDGVDPALASIVRRAMARDPSDRFSSAGELERALLEWIGRTPVGASAIAELLDARCGARIEAGPTLEPVEPAPTERASRVPIIAPEPGAAPRAIHVGLAIGLLLVGLALGWGLLLLATGD